MQKIATFQGTGLKFAVHHSELRASPHKIAPDDCVRYLPHEGKRIRWFESLLFCRLLQTTCYMIVWSWEYGSDLVHILHARKICLLFSITLSVIITYKKSQQLNLNVAATFAMSHSTCHQKPRLPCLNVFSTQTSQPPTLLFFPLNCRCYKKPRLVSICFAPRD